MKIQLGPDWVGGIMTDTLKRLEAITDEQAFDTLSRVVEGYAIEFPDTMIVKEEDTKRVLTLVGEQVDVSVDPKLDSQLSNASKSARNILERLAETESGAERVGGALDRLEDARIEPVTMALIMAGIVLVLETEVDLKVSRKDGKTDFDISISKKPTDKSIISKIFSVFG